MAKLNSGVFSSKSDEWTTPRDLFDRLNRRFLFDLDAAASDENHLCPAYYTKEDSGLDHSWEGMRVFCNCPYSQIKLWAKKFAEEAARPTASWHSFLRGRIPAGGMTTS